MFDVIVVGGGPAGLNAAKRMTEEGLNVCVLERKERIGEHIICTGIVSEEAFNEFELSRDSILMSINKFRWISPSDNQIEYKHPRVFAHIVDRKKFDARLYRYAEMQGVDVKLGRDVAKVSIGKNSVELTAKNRNNSPEKYTGQFVIIATGISFQLQRDLGLGYPKRFLNGVQAELDFGDIDCAQVYVGRDIAHGAFGWIVPIGEGIVRLGLMTEKDPKGCFDHLVKKLPQGRLSGLNKERIQYKSIAQGLVSKTFSDRVLTLGEAAGQVKTTTGGGIYFGLLCSEIAARIVVKNIRKKRYTSEALSEYETLWKKAIGKEILFGYLARKACSRFSDAEIEQMFYKAQTNGVLPLIKEKGNFDWHGSLLFPLIKKIPYWQLIKAKLRNINRKN
jgi:geranylgeranyl reductase family protein